MKKSFLIVFIGVFLLNIINSADCAAQKNQSKSKKETAVSGKKYRITIESADTIVGNIDILIYDKTPLHQKNFDSLVLTHYYDSILFHRVITEFMIQSGDPNSKHAPAGQALGFGGPSYTVPAEFDTNLFHKKGAIAGARLPDQVNPSRSSSGSQFYIVQGKKWTREELDMMSGQLGFKFSPAQIEAYTTIGGTPFLDRQYTVFGEVITGLKVVDAIAAVQKDRGDRPMTDIKIKSITALKK